MKQPSPFPVDMYFNPGLGAFTDPGVLQKFAFTDGDGQNAPQDGANRVPRKWSEAFFKEVLCRDLPVIRTMDAIAYVDVSAPEETNFRRGISCMTCHASMDSLAYLSRNYKNVHTDHFAPTRSPLATAQSLQTHAFLKPFLPAEVTNPEIRIPDKLARPSSDPLFAFRTADADFRFRDLHGTYHNVPLRASVDDPFKSYRQLASQLKEMDDTYFCFASKYVKYLTGLEVKPFDPGQMNAPILSAKDRKIYDWLVGVSRDFKTHQSAKKLIYDIVSSDFFLDPHQVGSQPSRGVASEN